MFRVMFVLCLMLSATVSIATVKSESKPVKKCGCIISESLLSNDMIVCLDGYMYKSDGINITPLKSVSGRPLACTCER